MQITKKNLPLLFTLLNLIAGSTQILAATSNTAEKNALQHLQQSYPDQIQAVSEQYITWRDGTRMALDAKATNRSAAEKIAAPTLADQIYNVNYPTGPQTTAPTTDPGRVRYLLFFKKIYGDSPQAVKNHLVTIYWLPKLYGKKYPLSVTTIEHVDKKLAAISAALEKLPPQDQKYLINPNGTFNWRPIAHTNRLSMHSFGMTIDLNSQYSNYWQWDLKKAGQPINEQTLVHYQNQIPWEIIKIFEDHGFIWGGKWYHYDTMHFEYRPELLP